MNYINTNTISNDSLVLFGSTDCSNMNISASLTNQDIIVPNNPCMNNTCYNSGDNQYLLTNGNCGASCDDNDYIRFFKCYSQCPEGTKVLGKKCVSACPIDKFTESNSFCVCYYGYAKISESDINVVTCETDCGNN